MSSMSGLNVLLKRIPYKFKTPFLLDSRAFIGGRWTPAASGATFPVYDPEDNQVAYKIANVSRVEVKTAIGAAQTASRQYKQLTHRNRKILLREWTKLIKRSRDDLAAICTLELGKPITESYTTVDYGISFLEWFEGEIERLYGETIPAARGSNRIMTYREPQGVVAAVTPWNSPVAMILRKVGAAISAGNAVVLKPAPETPMCAIAIAKLFEQVDYPEGTLNIVTGDAAASVDIGDEMCHNPAVRHLSFTGSTSVGKFLNAECAKHLKKTSMELGGNAPFIVFEDANIQKAVSSLANSDLLDKHACALTALLSTIPSSTSSQRDSRKQLMAFLNTGLYGTRMLILAPLYSSRGVEKAKAHQEDAVSKGAKIISGGFIKEDLGPNFYVPTILTGGPSQEMRSWTQETFGPVMHLTPFETEEEVIKLANTEESGLASYFYTEDISRVWRVSEALETGMVGVRTGLVSACEQPFGGIKESGIGREGSKFGVEDYTNIKSITVGL
ncbi:hypothetical protein N7481_009776 [Penicillium waksmanii]|uniref:uncharacterized protein n=1 Tax=Penicillium waksmanii TaxID=69791 RepID=UPI0025484DB4|nr:uncharacterized protein N7481_009776 [Penicillium waksmanii]KAJ5976069.1 hypothetical protein N7481_009776 [Penicillium waksmanii]